MVTAHVRAIPLLLEEAKACQWGKSFIYLYIILDYLCNSLESWHKFGEKGVSSTRPTFDTLGLCDLDN